MRLRLVCILPLATLSACASHTAPLTIATISEPPVVALPSAPPAGAAANLVIPAVLADGTYPTPNRALSGSAAIWHLRVALNVAALGCRGADETPIVSGYNAMLTARKTLFGAAQRQVAVEFGGTSSTAQAGYDHAMTLLYNFFAQPPAQAAFCATAAQVIAAEPTVTAADYPAFAEQSLAALDRPFTDFYRAYDAWRRQQTLIASPVMAVAAVASVSAVSGVAQPVVAIPNVPDTRLASGR